MPPLFVERKAMARSKYDISFESQFSGKVFQLGMAGCFPVLPGDSIKGGLQLKFTSDTLAKPVMHSAFIELSLFFVPHRIVWDGWMDFISKATGTMPTNNTVMRRFFRNGTAVFARNELLPRAYRAIYNEYYRDPNFAEETALPTDVYTVNRAKQYETMARDSAADSATVDTSGATLKVRDIKAAFASDRYNARREMYGDKYSDFLRACGVRPRSMMLEVPEHLGSMFKQLENKAVYDTSGSVGTPSSIYQSKCGMQIKDTKKFDEHGWVIGVFTFVPRVMNRNMGGHLEDFKTQADDFWTPEHTYQGPEAVKSAVWNGATAVTTFNFPKYEEYRRGKDQYFAPGVSPLTEWALSIAPAATTPDAYAKVTPSDFDGYFRNTIGTSGEHYAAGLYWNMSRLSMLPPAPVGSG